MLLAVSSHAATLNVPSCQLSAVQSAVASAADGDIVNIPAGTCNWGGPLTIGNKSITLKGQGPASTVIVCNHATDPKLLAWYVKPSGVSKVSDMTLDSGGPVVNGYWSMIEISGDTPNFIMHNVKLMQRRQRAITFNGYVRGVMSHVELHTYTFSAPIHMSHQNWGNVGDYGDNSWATDSTIGTSQAIYIEDSSIECHIGSYCPATDGDAGPRYVFRFNRLTNAQSLHHGLDTPGRLRATRHYEYYKNIIVNDVMQGITPIAARGGTGMVFDNTLTLNGGSSPAVFDFQVQRANQDPVVTQFFFAWNDCRVRPITQITCSNGIATATTPTVGADQTSHGVSAYSWVQISGSSVGSYNGNKAVLSPGLYDGRSLNTFTFAATCGGTASNGGMTLRSPYDGNTSANGYPCTDQAGRGKGALLTGFDAAGRGTDGIMTAIPVNQQLEPIYVWNNTKNGVLSPASVPYTDPAVVAPNRDYYDQNDASCPAGGGSCTAGVGRGTLAQRPGACTAGVGYWATDQGDWNTTNGTQPDGRLYKCVSTNNWQVHYTPYTYPHPLTTGSTIPPPPPPPPPPSTGSKFVMGDRVVSNSDILVRNSPGFGTNGLGDNVTGSHLPGALATVVAAPQFVEGYWWVQVNYDTGTDGWSSEPNLDKVAGSSACDVNGDGTANVADVQLSANQAIGSSPCSTGDINRDSACNVIDVQRVVNAALGGQCVTQ